MELLHTDTNRILKYERDTFTFADENGNIAKRYFTYSTICKNIDISNIKIVLYNHSVDILVPYCRRKFNMTNESSDAKIPYPLCIINDRYSGIYYGAEFLAFNLSPCEVGMLPVDDGDNSCLYFWEHEAADYVIGKGKLQKRLCRI